LYLSICFHMFSYSLITTFIYTLSLHDALPISILYDVDISKLSLALKSKAVKFKDKSVKSVGGRVTNIVDHLPKTMTLEEFKEYLDRKSTRLNSSHVSISYAVFCLKKKIKKT